jgi:UDP-N-acetylglucosamine 2-epimerase (non-hydrolysing)
VRLVHVCGARPNFMKVAPLVAAVTAWKADGVSPPVTFSQVLIHTGQHYDSALSDVFLEQLGLPQPDHHLGVGSGSHEHQKSQIINRLAPVLAEERPDLVLVVGDVNSTVAAAECAGRLAVPVAHVEAGLRSGDLQMPEERNRIETDALSSLLFTTERAAELNLQAEGIDDSRVHFVGNTMIDTLERLLPVARGGDALERHRVDPREYGVVTLHRPSNVDEPAQLRRLIGALGAVAQRLPLMWPVHPRVQAHVMELSAFDGRMGGSRLRRVSPAGYLDFLQLMDGARMVLTDSGGIQEETTVLGVPCLTLRTTTERPVTVTEGTNRLVDPYDEAAILGAVDEVLSAPMPAAVHPEQWDGHAAERIVSAIAEWVLGGR